MTRVAVALAVVIALAAGVWMLWPDDERTPSTATTLPVAGPSSTTSIVTESTTTTHDEHIVTTVEEAEEILRELWFGWFEGIYNEDEDRIREVVESEAQVKAATEQFGLMGFTGPPSTSAIQFSEIRILRADLNCLATWSVTRSPAFLAGSESRQGVDVFQWTDGQWLLASSWKYEGDLWEADCGASLG